MSKYRNSIKQIFSMACLLLICILAGCSDEMEMPDVPEPVAKDGYINITVAVAGEDQATRATEPGVDPYNENLITSVTVCLWPNGGDWTETRNPMVMETFPVQNELGQTVVRIPLTQDLINHLFRQDSSNTCHVYAAVNLDLPQDTIFPVANLKKRAITSNFKDMQVQPKFVMEGSSSVKLDGNSAVGLVEVQRSAVKIDLHVTGKSVVEGDLDGELVKWTAHYEDMTVRLVHGVSNSTLVPNAREGVDERYYFTTPSDLEYGFEVKSGDDNSHPGPSGTSDGKTEYIQKIPFYTYPNAWTESLTDMNRTRMLLAVPWTSDKGDNYRVCYYQVPVVNLDKTEIVRNVSYHVNVDVSVLGSLVPEEPMLVEDVSYTAAPWGTKSIDTTLTDVRYLVFDQTEYVVNNANQIDISFYTSHPVVVTDCYMVFYRFNYSDTGDEFPVKVSRTQNSNSFSHGSGVYSVAFSSTGPNQQVLTYKHELVCFQPYINNTTQFSLTNNYNFTAAAKRTPAYVPLSTIEKAMEKITWFQRTDVPEYSVCEFYVTVQHQDKYNNGENTFKESLKITQYPGMYITTLPNTSDRFVVSGDNITASRNMCNVFINNNIDANGNILAGSGWTSVIGLSSISYYNWNPNMYLLTITRLDNEDYIINDPRRIAINNNLSNNSMSADNNQKEYPNAWATFTTARYVGGGNKTRTLSYYHPTNETEEAENMIAPKIRICSSAAGTGALLNRQNARRRAAAFQEMGYPAGRWRLPTWGEVRFIVDLSDTGKIPRLFGVYVNDNWHYWCAQGAVKVPGKPSYPAKSVLEKDWDVTKAERARFVYDEWYWGSETLKSNGNKPNDGKPIYEFTWGDSPDPLNFVK